MQFPMAIISSIKNVKDEVSLIFFITCCISKFMKLFWINLLTVKSLIDQIRSFEIEVENIRMAELN